MEQTTVSARIPESLYTSLEGAANANGLFQSEMVRHALRYYAVENPDNLPELDAFEMDVDLSVRRSDCQLQEENN